MFYIKCLLKKELIEFLFNKKYLLSVFLIFAFFCAISTLSTQIEKTGIHSFYMVGIMFSSCMGSYYFSQSLKSDFLCGVLELDFISKKRFSVFFTKSTFSNMLSFVFLTGYSVFLNFTEIHLFENIFDFLSVLFIILSSNYFSFFLCTKISDEKINEYTSLFGLVVPILYLSFCEKLNLSLQTVTSVLFTLGFTVITGFFSAASFLKMKIWSFNKLK